MNNLLVLGSYSAAFGLAVASAIVLKMPTATIMIPGIRKATRKFHHTQKSSINFY